MYPVPFSSAYNMLGGPSSPVGTTTYLYDAADRVTAINEYGSSGAALMSYAYSQRTPSREATWMYKLVYILAIILSLIVPFALCDDALMSGCSFSSTESDLGNEKPNFQLPASAIALRLTGDGSSLMVYAPTAPAHQIAESHLLFIDVKNGREKYRAKCTLNPSIGTSQGVAFDGTNLDTIQPAKWAISPNGKLLATLQSNRSSGDCDRLVVIELDSGNIAYQAVEIDDVFSYLLFSSDSKFLGAATKPTRQKTQLGRSFVIRSWPVISWKERAKLKLPLPRSVDQVLFELSPDGRYTMVLPIAGTKKETVRVWDSESPNATYGLAGQPNNDSNFVFTPDGKGIVGYDDGITLWDSSTGDRIKKVAPCPSNYRLLELSPDGSKAIANNLSGISKVKMWDFATGKEINLPVDSILSLLFSDDSRTVLLEDQEGRIVACDTRTGKARNVVALGHRTWWYGDYYYNAHQGLGRPYALSHNGEVLVGCVQGMIRFIEIRTGKQLGGLTVTN